MNLTNFFYPSKNDRAIHLVKFYLAFLDWSYLPYLSNAKARKSFLLKPAFLCELKLQLGWLVLLKKVIS